MGSDRGGLAKLRCGCAQLGVVIFRTRNRELSFSYRLFIIKKNILKNTHAHTHTLISHHQFCFGGKFLKNYFTFLVKFGL